MNEIYTVGLGQDTPTIFAEASFLSFVGLFCCMIPQISFVNGSEVAIYKFLEQFSYNIWRHWTALWLR